MSVGSQYTLLYVAPGTSNLDGARASRRFAQPAVHGLWHQPEQLHREFTSWQDAPSAWACAGASRDPASSRPQVTAPARRREWRFTPR
ncbi:hypothetical protein [Kutzneria buriramensis]|uniref:hypothetical protein n=1 Tax=Kutzneria buriramensis TaxID=1045776 RepID=UPI00319E0F64